MTSGMSAKDTALGTNAPGNGVPLNRAPAPRNPGTSGNGTARRGRGTRADHGPDKPRRTWGRYRRNHAGGRREPEQFRPVPVLASWVRMLILGIDYDGRIVQHDRNAAAILARRPDELLGAQLSDLTVAPAQGNSHPARSGDGVAAVSGLLEAIRSDREGSAMLTIETRDGHPAEAVVTVHPMRAGGTSLAALALLRVPAPAAERFVDPAVMRKQMLDDTFTRIGDTLDIDHLARELIDALVSHFCNAADLLLLGKHDREQQ